MINLFKRKKVNWPHLTKEQKDKVKNKRQEHGRYNGDKLLGYWQKVGDTLYRVYYWNGETFRMKYAHSIKESEDILDEWVDALTMGGWA